MHEPNRMAIVIAARQRNEFALEYACGPASKVLEQTQAAYCTGLIERKTLSGTPPAR